MRSIGILMLITVVASGLGCGARDEPAKTEPAAAPPQITVSTPELLERPFTADQIRDEWVEGFELRIRQRSLEGETFERWTVVWADEEAVDIGSVGESASGDPLGEMEVGRSTWVELRDHASFPAAQTVREWVTRSTPLGELDGWLYTVGDADGGSFSEFFFAESLPGTPVVYRTVQEGKEVARFEQVERSRP